MGDIQIQRGSGTTISGLMGMRRTGFAAALLSVCVLAACSDGGAQRHLDSGKEHLGRNEISSALIDFKNAVKAAPDQAEAHFLLGVALRRSADPEGARIEFRKALSLGYPPAVVVRELGPMLVESGAADMAIALLGEFPASQLGDAAEIEAIRAQALLASGKAEEAANLLQAGDPRKTPSIAVGQAKLALDRGDIPTAIGIVEKVLAEKPETENAWYLKGLVLSRQNRVDEAMAALEKADARQPGDLRIHAVVIPMLVRSGRIEATQTWLAKLERLRPGALITFYLNAQVASARHEYQTARGFILDFLKTSAEDPTALLLASSIENALGNHTLAEEHLKKVVANLPEYADARRLLAATYVRMGVPFKARGVLDPLLAPARKDFDALLLAADIAREEKRPELAREYLRRARNLERSDALSLTRLGQSLLRAGDVTEGARVLDAAAAIPQPSPIPLEALLAFRVSRGDESGALAAARALDSRLPNSATGRSALGVAHFLRKDWAKARQHFEEALQRNGASVDAVSYLTTLDLMEGQGQKALERLEAMARTNPRSAEVALLLIGTRQKLGGNPVELLEAVERAVARHPLAAALHVIRVDQLLLLGRTRDAVNAGNRARSLLPDDLQVLAALARAQIAAGEISSAIDTYGRLSTLDPRGGRYVLAQAEGYALERNWDAARRTLGALIERDRDHLPALVALTEVSLRAGEHARAATDARRIVNQWPQAPAGHLLLGRALMAAKDLTAAEAALRAGLERTADSRIAAMLVGLASATRGVTGAESEARRWLEKHPGDATVMGAAADAHASARDFAGAVRWYRAALEVVPKHAGFLNNLALSMGRLDDREALAVAERAVAAAPDSGSTLDTLGALRLQFGNASDAVEPLRRAAQLMPRVAVIRANLAEALSRSGKLEEARKELDAAEAIGPTAELRQRLLTLRQALPPTP